MAIFTSGGDHLFVCDCSASFLFFFISLFEWNGIGTRNFVGIQNYSRLIIEDSTFHKAICNNLIWIVLTIFVTMTVSLGFAVILNKNFKGRTFLEDFFIFHV